MDKETLQYFKENRLLKITWIQEDEASKYENYDPELKITRNDRLVGVYEDIPDEEVKNRLFREMIRLMNRIDTVTRFFLLDCNYQCIYCSSLLDFRM